MAIPRYRLTRQVDESDENFQRRVAAAAGAQDVDARLAAHEMFGECLDDFARRVEHAAALDWRRSPGKFHLDRCRCRCSPVLRQRLIEAQEKQNKTEAAAAALVEASRSVRLGILINGISRGAAATTSDYTGFASKKPVSHRRQLESDLHGCRRDCAVDRAMNKLTPNARMCLLLAGSKLTEEEIGRFLRWLHEEGPERIESTVRNLRQAAARASRLEATQAASPPPQEPELDLREPDLREKEEIRSVSSRASTRVAVRAFLEDIQTRIGAATASGTIFSGPAVDGARPLNDLGVKMHAAEEALRELLGAISSLKGG